MAEEFQESEVIFQENVRDDEDDHNCNHSGHYYSGHPREMIRKNNNLKKKKKSKKHKNSGPVNIPENASVNANSWIQYVDSDIFDDDDDGEITPPHVILGRRIAGKMAFSVCTGTGRTLKGRDLSEVRNSILRMTGFLET